MQAPDEHFACKKNYIGSETLPTSWWSIKEKV